MPTGFIKKLLTVSLLSFLLAATFSGCSVKTDKTTKLEDLDFTVVSEELLPTELKEILTEKKMNEFKVTYSNDGFLYICIGYGEQATGGYSIAVDALYLTENSIVISTSLLGPGPEDNAAAAPSYPYIVVKTEYLDKTVVFE